MSQVIPLGPASRMLTTREAATRLGVSLRTVQLWVEASILPAARTPGGHRRIPYNAVEALAMSMGLESLGEPGTAPSVPASKSASHHAEVRPLRIVLVAQERPWLAACVSALEVFGQSVSVETADNGYVALLRIGQQPPDLLVTTLELPGMDGLQMLSTLETHESLGGMRVWALTAESPEELSARGGLPPMVETLALPVSPEALAIRTGRWVLARQSTDRSIRQEMRQD
ncbi:MAG: excisionase family DNA-binding protein [Pseudomonadota bacterium]